MNVLWIILALILSYIFGSIPFGLILGKLVKKIDIREHGSKNVGSTNVARLLGFKWGLLNFILDALKGALPILVIRTIFDLTNLYMINEIDFSIMYGAIAAIGHVFSIFIKFKGGRAVATSVGAIIALAPVIGFGGILAFAIIVLITKYASLASIIATSLVGVATYLDVFIWEFEFNGGFRANIVNIIIISALVLMIIIKHRANIVKLLNGTENKFGSKNKTPKN